MIKHESVKMIYERYQTLKQDEQIDYSRKML